jgi:hypothetical protein
MSVSLLTGNTNMSVLLLQLEAGTFEEEGWDGFGGYSFAHRPNVYMPEALFSFGRRKTHTVQDLLRRAGGDESTLLPTLLRRHQSKKKKFAVFVYKNCGHTELSLVRQTFFTLLSEYKRVDALGACMHNADTATATATATDEDESGTGSGDGAASTAAWVGSDPWDGLTSVYSEYKFVITMVRVKESGHHIIHRPLILQYIYSSVLHLSSSESLYCISRTIYSSALHLSLDYVMRTCCCFCTSC